MNAQSLESRSAATARDDLIAAIASTADEAQKLTYRLFLSIYDDLGRRLDALHEDEAHKADHALIDIIRTEREEAALVSATNRGIVRDQIIRQLVVVAMSLFAGAVGMFAWIPK